MNSMKRVVYGLATKQQQQQLRKQINKNSKTSAEGWAEKEVLSVFMKTT